MFGYMPLIEAAIFKHGLMENLPIEFHNSSINA